MKHPFHKNSVGYRTIGDPYEPVQFGNLELSQLQGPKPRDDDEKMISSLLHDNNDNNIDDDDLTPQIPRNDDRYCMRAMLAAGVNTSERGES